MIACVHRNGMLELLAIPDTGDFSGETEFLTSRKIDATNISMRTFGTFMPLRALMLMTDGVADDYFPNDPQMKRLYADLVLNQIINIQYPGDEAVKSKLESTNLKSVDDVANADFCVEVERITEANPRPTVKLRSAEKFAELLGIDVNELAAQPELLCAGSRAENLLGGDDTPEKRLEVWLDSYQVRGSFDDRTLAVLFPVEKL